jgi:hypothetical protein
VILFKRFLLLNFQRIADKIISDNKTLYNKQQKSKRIIKTTLSFEKNEAVKVATLLSVVLYITSLAEYWLPAQLQTGTGRFATVWSNRRFISFEYIYLSENYYNRNHEAKDCLHF